MSRPLCCPVPAPKGGQLGSLGTSLDSPTPDDILQEQAGESSGLSSRSWSSPVLPYPQVSNILKFNPVMGERLMVAMSMA